MRARPRPCAPPAARAAAAASVLGIPEDEFTPRVRDAIMTLMGEVDALRRELAADARAAGRGGEDRRSGPASAAAQPPRLRARADAPYRASPARYGTPASLIYFDLDGFKPSTTRYGHAGGRCGAGAFRRQSLLANVRDSDVVGRLGGDEFGVILSPRRSGAGAQEGGSCWRRCCTRADRAGSGRTIPVGFSYGAFELQAGDNADIAMARADEAMYAHKRARALSRQSAKCRALTR